MMGGKQTAVGAFVLGGIALALGAAVLFGKFHLLTHSVRAVVVFQDSIKGLVIGAPVTFRGVQVGAVETIAIQFDAKENKAYIPVTVALQPGRAHILGRSGIEIPDVPHLVEQGLRAQLELQSFVTGQSEIDLDFDPAAPEVLHPEITNLPEIPTVQSSLQRVTDQLTQLPLRELAANAITTMQSLRTLSEDVDSRLPALADSLHATVENAGQTATAATAAINDLRQRLDQTLADADQLILAGNRQLEQRGAELHTLLGQSSATVREGGEVMRDLQTLTANRSPLRMTMDAALRDLAAATASLRGFASDVERNPQLLLTGRRP